jgi:hypothetical protein
VDLQLNNPIFILFTVLSYIYDNVRIFRQRVKRREQMHTILLSPPTSLSTGRSAQFLLLTPISIKVSILICTDWRKIVASTASVLDSTQILKYSLNSKFNKKVCTQSNGPSSCKLEKISVMVFSASYKLCRKALSININYYIIYI